MGLIEDNIVGLIGLAIFLLWVGFTCVRTIRPTCRGIIERVGKYHSYQESGLVILAPFIDRLIEVNITEQMVNADSQEVITKDNLNAMVDAQIYFKVRADEQNIKRSQYAVNNCKYQIVQLTRTTLRAVMGNLTLTEANSERAKLNDKLANELKKQTEGWGVEVIRAELQEIQPPKDVQETMNNVVKANNTKIAAVDYATAAETQADGKRRAAIKEAEGEAKAITTIANAKAEQIKVVNEAAQKYFKDNAVVLKKLETAEAILKDNTKIIVPSGSDLVNVVGESVGIIPLNKKGDKL